METKVKPEIASKKAQLLAGGPVKLPLDFKLPFPPSRSTAGPGAGYPSIVFSFGNTRAKKPISREVGDFELVVKGKKLCIIRDGEVFIDGVRLLPTLLHAPYQAFVNISHSCIYSCKFCNSPRLGADVLKNLTDDKIIEMVQKASENEDFESVAFTSAVAQSPTLTNKRMTSLVKRTRALLPKTPIGVEPYATRPDEIDAFKDAGADEIKLNIESYSRDIFDKVCPDRDYDLILHAINHAGETFGKNRVCSNIIFGLGETDGNILEGTKVLANMGAVATLRALRRSDYNIIELEKTLGPLPVIEADRMLSLAKQQKRILKSYGLTPLKFKTMCHACLACDIVPFWDV